MLQFWLRIGLILSIVNATNAAQKCKNAGSIMPAYKTNIASALYDE